MKGVATEFVKFSAIGVLGFLIDSTILSVLIMKGGLGLYASRLCSFMAAATTTWYLNRRFTFDGGKKDRVTRQWARFIAVNGLGGGVNYGTYALLVATSNEFARYPIAAVAIGSMAGLLLNFTTSRNLVFR